MIMAVLSLSFLFFSLFPSPVLMKSMLKRHKLGMAQSARV